HRFGGSHAQRDLIHLTLVEAALRAGKIKLARALVAERTQLKAASPLNWQLSARVSDAIGEADRAARARESAETRRRAHFAGLGAWGVGPGSYEYGRLLPLARAPGPLHALCSLARYACDGISMRRLFVRSNSNVSFVP